MTESIVVVARWEIPIESLTAVLALVAEVTPASLSEPGCIGYEVLQGIERPTTVVLIERYVDRAALDAHLSSPHYKDVIAGRIRPLLTSRQVEIVQPPTP